MINRPRDDEGSALILALVFMTVISIILAALLSFAQTTQKTTVALRDESATTYEVDGALQQAVNTMQNGAFINDDGSLCFGADDTAAGVATDKMVIPDPDGSGSIVVVCDGTPGSGVQSPEVPITTVNKPGNAILTLGDADTDGLNVESTYNLFSRFDVGGPVFSYGPIKTNGKSLTARGYVRARGVCPDAAKISPTPECDYDGYDGGLPPNYALPADAPGSAAIPYRKVSPSTCTPFFGIRPTVTFEPGYYDDAAALNQVTSRDCIFWFKPGTYYFDFHNGDNTALPSGSHEWQVTDGRLIAGTRTTTFPLLGTQMDCRSPLKSTTNNGVRFVFGGNSRLSVSGDGSAAICGTYSSTAPAIAVQGVTSGSESSATVIFKAPAPTPTPSPSPQGSVTSFTRNPAGAATRVWEGAEKADSVTAKWTKARNTSQSSGNLELTGFVPATTIPAGSVIDTAVVNVRHNSPTTKSGDSRSVVLTVSGQTCTLSVPNLHAGSLFTDELNALTGCSSAFVQALHTSGVSTTGMKLNYSVTLARDNGIDRTEELDELSLTVTYRAPAYRAQGAAAGDTCDLGATFVPNASFTGGRPGECAGLFLRSGVGTILPGINTTVINGTVSLPESAVAVRLDALSSSGLKSGVVSRSLYLRAAGILTFASVASVPFSSQGTDPSAYLTAYDCETPTYDPATCEPKVKAKVTLVGTDPNNRREAKIQSYSVLQ